MKHFGKQRFSVISKARRAIDLYILGFLFILRQDLRSRNLRLNIILIMLLSEGYVIIIWEKPVLSTANYQRWVSLR